MQNEFTIWFESNQLGEFPTLHFALYYFHF